jgi:hypothetical protein
MFKPSRSFALFPVTLLALFLLRLHRCRRRCGLCDRLAFSNVNEKRANIASTIDRPEFGIEEFCLAE